MSVPSGCVHRTASRDRGPYSPPSPSVAPTITDARPASTADQRLLDQTTFTPDREVFEDATETSRQGLGPSTPPVVRLVPPRATRSPAASASHRAARRHPFFMRPSLPTTGLFRYQDRATTADARNASRADQRPTSGDPHVPRDGFVEALADSTSRPSAARPPPGIAGADHHRAGFAEARRPATVRVARFAGESENAQPAVILTATRIERAG